MRTRGFVVVAAWFALSAAALVANAEVPEVTGKTCVSTCTPDAYGNVTCVDDCSGGSSSSSGGGGATSSGPPMPTQRKEFALRMGQGWHAPGEDSRLDFSNNTFGFEALLGMGGRPSLAITLGLAMDVSSIKTGVASKYLFAFPLTMGIAITPALGRAMRGVLAFSGGFVLTDCSDGIPCKSGFYGEMRVGLELHPRDKAGSRDGGIGLEAVFPAVMGDDGMQPPVAMLRLSLALGNPALPW